MGRPVVHVEIIGADPARLCDYYAGLFDWQLAAGDAVTTEVAAPGEYWFLDRATTEGDGVNGGIGGGAGYQPRVLFYVGVPDVETALAEAERRGGTRLMGPEPSSGDFTVGRFADLEGNVVGVAGPSA